MLHSALGSAERALRGVRPPRAGQGRGAAAREATAAPGPSGRGYGKISRDDAGGRFNQCWIDSTICAART
jgi:hypothetical protein